MFFIISFVCDICLMSAPNFYDFDLGFGEKIESWCEFGVVMTWVGLNEIGGR